jgi:L-fuculose-phosphate aldolase
MNYAGGDLRDQLAQVGLSVVTSGLVVGSGGNLSARLPGTEEFWVTAAGTWLDRLDRPHFSRLSLTTGSVVDGTPPPTTELMLHLATYRARPDAMAVIHLHPQTAILLDALGERIRLVSTDHRFYLRRVVTTPFAPPGTPKVAELAARAISDGTNCVLMSRHGCSVLADSIELAHKRAMYLEEAAQLTYRALVAGVLDRLDDAELTAQV